MTSRGRYLFLSLVILAFQAVGVGCSDDSQAPTPPKIELALQVSSETVVIGDAFTAEARVRNVGGGSVRYGADCCGDGTLVEIRDSSGDFVTSNVCLALCPGTMKDLTDQVLVSTLQFDGTVWRDGEKVDIPPGEYTVTATFRYDTQLVEKSRVVKWVAR